MEYNIVPNGQEYMFYSRAPEEHRCIGHVRIDFGHGDEFYSSW